MAPKHLRAARGFELRRFFTNARVWIVFLMLSFAGLVTLLLQLWTG